MDPSCKDDQLCPHSKDHLQSKPELRELVHYSDKIVTCWKQLALQLSLSPEVVDIIDLDYNKVKDKCYGMFKSWLMRTCDPCWCQVASAFKMVKLNEAAGEIEKKFVQSKVVLPQPVPPAGTSLEILKEKPEMFDLIKIVIPRIMDKWEYVAYAFRYDPATVISIKQKERGDPRECFREFFTDWLTTNHGAVVGPKTWSTLLDVLKNNTDIAAGIIEDITKEVQQLKPKKYG